tara:strand:- start:29616 stop:30146 length:531 start_codon:yes stop_codon:yes gene_type:complete
MKKIILWANLLFLFACSSGDYRNQIADNVDLNSFMTKWYVIAHIPTFIEDTAFNAIETYSQNSDGTIHVEFTFNDKSSEGEFKRYTQKGWVVDQKSKAHWKVSPFWPLKFDYLIHYISQDGQFTMIGVPDHSYLWLMSKTPSMAADERDEMEEMAEELGYDLSKLRDIPQKEASVK